MARNTNRAPRVLLNREKIMEITISESGCCTEIKVEGPLGSATAATKGSEVKEQIRQAYGKNAERKSGCGCSSETDGTFMAESYEGREGYESDADLALGCGIPTDLADLREGQDVLDLGSGAGIDAFIVSKIVGSEGSVTGLDFTPQMIELARKNAANGGYQNVQFVEGDIEEMPLPNGSFDRIVSNCVINLVPDKKKAFEGMFRVLRHEGSFTVSDVVLEGVLPPTVKASAEMIAGCVAGAVTRENYLDVVREVGFTNVTVQRERQINLSNELLGEFASKEEIKQFRDSGAAIISLTVTGHKA